MMASPLQRRQGGAVVLLVAFEVKLSSIQALPLEGCALLSILHNLSVLWYPSLPLKALKAVLGTLIAFNKG